MVFPWPAATGTRLNCPAASGTFLPCPDVTQTVFPTFCTQPVCIVFIHTHNHVQLFLSIVLRSLNTSLQQERGDW